MPPKSREEVVDPFAQPDDARRDAGGSWLGLTIARDIARTLGDVTLYDNPLGGYGR